MEKQPLTLKEKIFNVKKDLTPITKEISNTFFKSKYFDINKLLEHIEDKLVANRILLTQPIIENKVYTILEDLDSDEKRESFLELKTDFKPQDKGSEITYYRRYTLQSLLGIASSEDDDGNKTNNTTQKQEKLWLNVKTKDGQVTADYKNVCACIKSRQYKSIDDIKKYYKISADTEVSLVKAFEKYQPL